MRPHRLRVTAFGAFAGTEEIRFDELEGLFLLHGETGAGKTTLLDAIAFALYGRVPGERGKAKRLRSDHAAADVRTEVLLEATVGGRRLRVTRRPEQDRPRKSGTGTRREQASVLLEELTGSGAWEVKSTRIGEADAEIGDLMGMSADQFFQVVLLPQGQFAQFLHADAAARAALLQKLFGTGRFRAVEDWLAERRRTTREEVETALAVVGSLAARVAQVAGVQVPGDAAGDAGADAAAMPDPAAAWQAAWAEGLLVAARAQADAAARLAAARERDLDAALAGLRDFEQLADRQRRRGDAMGRRGELEAAGPAIEALRAELDAANRAAEVAPVLDEAARAVAAATAARAAAQSARAAVPAGLPGFASPGGAASGAASADGAGVAGAALRDAGAEVLRTVAAGQRERLGRLAALRAVARQAADEDKAAASARERAAQLETALAATQDEIAGSREMRPEAVAARDGAGQAAADLPAATAAADSARRAAADSAALLKEHASRERLHEAHVAARESAAALREEAQRLREARFDGMRAELAAGLVAGTPCPVCGSLTHPELCELTGEPVSREQEEEAYADYDRAAAKADKAGQDVAAADARIGQLTRQLAAAGFGAGGSGAFAAASAPPGAGAGGSGIPGGGTAQAGPAEASLAAAGLDRGELAAAVKAADADAKRLEAEADRLRSAAASLADAQGRLDALDAAIAAAERRQAGLAEQRSAALAEAEGAGQRAADSRESLRTHLGDAAGLEDALEATRQLADALSAAADAADEAARATAEAHAAGERAVAAAAGAGFDGPDAEAGYAGVDAARAAVREAGWRKSAGERIRGHEASAEAVGALLADPELDVALQPPAPVAAAVAAVAKAREDLQEAAGAHDVAKHTAQQLASLAPELAAALAALTPLEAKAAQARQLADLAGGLGTNQYRMTLSSFVLAARLEEVATAASQRLLTMTAGRYSLVHTDARRGGGRSGLGLLACDSWTGQDRDTSTLSGGETFLASLALALGLADVVTAEAAGTPMEALFVDEGFGTLDEETLEEVMTVLDGLREGGRMVGIVSHVSELRQRIPAQVHVRKGRHGSRVRVTAG